jgi:FixJ family two-component response regulator
LNDTTRPLIAVVDDDPSFLRSVGRLLRSTGYAVATFGTAREFIAALPGIAPTCVVLDVHMPDMTGLELQERLATQGRCPPTVLVTAYDTPQTRERARQAGSFGLLVKPFDKQELLNALAEAMRCQCSEAAAGQT